MTAERNLRVLHTQAEFHLGETAVAFSGASVEHSRALRVMQEIESINEMVRQELRRLAERPLLNVALHDALRNMLAEGRSRKEIAAKSLDQALQRLDAARTELGHCRQRESCLEHLIEEERRKKRLTRQVRDELIADDLWLQTNWARS
jgi:Arc/MetJ-type ribon-helix-helix transcriptional regulator